MTTKTSQRAESKLRHALALKRLFPASEYSPMTLLAKLHRIEATAHRYAEQECNGDVELTDEQSAARDKRILDRVDALTDFRALGIPVFLNGDPRGYALKIKDDWMRDHQDARLHTDWGGYGILAPDFN